MHLLKEIMCELIYLISKRLHVSLMTGIVILIFVMSLNNYVREI